MLKRIIIIIIVIIIIITLIITIIIVVLRCLCVIPAVMTFLKAFVLSAFKRLF
jgi:hypothetical protein